MPLITVAAGQPIRSTHCNQFSQWITGGRKDVALSLITTSPTDYTAVVTNEDTSAGLIAKFGWGATTAMTVNKTGVTMNVPLISSNPLAGLFTTAGQLVYGSGGTAAATLAIGTTNQALHVSASGLPFWAASPTSTLTAQGDLLGASAANTLARIPKGLTFQSLAMNAGATGQTYVSCAVATLSTQGDMVYASAANTLERIVKGSDGQVLTLASGVPGWAAASAGVPTQNLIPNGGQDIWGSTTSFGTGAFATAADTVTVPGWVSRREGGADTLTVAQETTIIDAAQGGRYATKIVKTGTAGLASHRVNLTPNLINELRGRSVTLQINARQGVASNVRASINDGSLTSSATSATTGAYVSYSVSKTISTTATSLWVGLELGVSANAADTVYVDNASLVVGATAVSYTPTPIAAVVPKAKFYNASSQSGTDGVVFALTVTSVAYNTGEFTVSSSSRVAVSIAGYYDIKAAGEFAADADGWRLISIRKNGTDYLVQHRSAIGSGSVPHPVSAAVTTFLLPTDYVEAVFQHNAGNALAVNNGAGGYENHISLELVP
jgi:phage tail tube protein FII